MKVAKWPGQGPGSEFSASPIPTMHQQSTDRDRARTEHVAIKRRRSGVVVIVVLLHYDEAVVKTISALISAGHRFLQQNFPHPSRSRAGFDDR